MPRIGVLCCLLAYTGVVAAQTAPTSDPTAVSLVAKSIAALTGGTVISDVTLNANVTSIFGSDNETGTGAFLAKGLGESRVDLSLSGRTRSDIRNAVNGFPAGAWSQNGQPSQRYAGHNCWTDAAWFFPALTALAQTANLNFVFQYIGQEQHGGVSAQHIRVFQTVQQDRSGAFQRLSGTDLFLDVNSSLPLAIATKTHPDNDIGVDIPVEVRFANYQQVNGIMVPFHLQQMLNGGVVLDATITSATVNTGLSDTLFSLP